ncbi:DUF4393 domain-containing protein [Bradyrhizobium hipponense]|uniref:DUF4393 domain-containing protein n=1 Tax=Bradyrhizobium hipponense TaxID=2605638 RepID=A0A5S4YP20_9BRAD|nr:DUF4393 domain-containing protein [Bradyrhizobium hipponense]TYO66151.1 DUF4393 domain-containing protein [Bradyrhizobium hipponense]
MVGDKATEELAKLGNRSLESIDKVGSWLDGVFGEGFREVGHAFADSMAGFRIRNRLRVIEKTQKAIDLAGLVGHTRPLPGRLTGPIMDAIGDESDETLQDVWAAYLAFSVNPKNPSADKLLIDVIRRLEPQDWPILRKLFRSDPKQLLPDDLGAAANDLEVTMDRLTALGLLQYDDPKSTFLVDGNHFAGTVSVKIGDGRYYETKLLRRLKGETEEAWK